MGINLESAYDLQRRTLAGGSWLFFSRLGQKVVYLIQISVMARLLDPKAFGLVDLANLAIAFIGIFIYTGVELALIQKPDLKNDDIHTAWWVMLGRHSLIAVTLAILANTIGVLFKSPEATPLLLAFAVMQPILGLMSASPILFRRNLEFRKLFYMEAGSSVVGLFIGIIAALILQNVWALLFSLLSTHLAYLLISYLVHPYRPKWVISRTCLIGFTKYGLWALGSNILWFVSSQGSGAFAGWMFGMSALGLYQMAGRFAFFPSIHLNAVFESTLMPAYSMIQNDKNRLSQAFLKSVSLASMVIMVITALVALGLPRLLTLLLGDHWAEASSLVLPIAIAAGAQSLLRTGTPLFFGVGRPRLQFLLDLVQGVTTVSLLWPIGRGFGLFGLPFAALGGALCSLPIWGFGIRRTTNCCLIDIFRAVIPPGLGVGTMIMVFYFGQGVAVTETKTLLAIVWHLTLMGTSTFAYLLTIALGQHFIPNYAPLADMKSFFKKKWMDRR
jgi:O-antigen/teichoic acid export membrane protein